MKILLEEAHITVQKKTGFYTLMQATIHTDSLKQRTMTTILLKLPLYISVDGISMYLQRCFQ